MRRAVRRQPVPWPWVVLGSSVVAVWAAATGVGGFTWDVSDFSFTVTAGGAAAGAGVALLTASASRPRGWALVPLLISALALPTALALAASGEDARPAIVLVAVVVALAVASGARDRTARLRAVGLAGMGTALLAAAVLSRTELGYSLGATGDEFGVALVIGSALLIVSGAGGSVEIPGLKPLLAVGLVAGLVGASAVGGLYLPLLVGAAAVGIAGVRPPAAVALFAVALAALPGGQSAAALVGAGALVAVALDRDWAVVAALPGGIAMVEALMLPGAVAPRVAVGVAAVLIVVQLALTLVPRRGPDVEPPGATRLAAPIDLARLPNIGRRRAERHRIPALVIGTWLVVAPGSWSWAGQTRLHDYDIGAGRAVATTLVVMTALSAVDQIRRRRQPTMTG